MDDLRAVMDAASMDQAALLGISEGGPLTALFAATQWVSIRLRLYPRIIIDPSAS
jgi:pimeloyl-ACP methyl ester carboxylesterase